MRHNRFVLMVMCALLLLAVSVPGVFALWTYFDPPEPVEEELSVSLSEWTYVKYSIRFVNDGVSLEQVDVMDNSAAIRIENLQQAQSAQEKAMAAMGSGYEFSHWMNAGSTRVDEIPAGHTEDVVLYPSFVGRYTAMFVDQDGNILAWDTFTKNSYNNVKTLGNDTVPPVIEDCSFDYWEVHVTDSTGKTIKTAKLADYKFNDSADVTIYPIYTYNGDVNLIPVDTNGDGTTDEYHVGGYSNPNGQNLVVIPDKVNGIEITAINANAFSSYDGVHSVVIPKTVTTVGGNALAIDWHWINNRAGETVTIYYEGSMAEWLALEATFTDGWDDGLGGSSRIFFLNGTDQVDPSQGYLQAKLSTSWGVGESITWNQATVTTALKNEYDNKCTCKDCNGADRPDRQYWTGVVIG